jgi:peptide/nickel transport system permease protein
MHRLLARRLAALVVTTLIALSFGHVIFNAGLDQMSWGAAITDIPGHLRDIVTGNLGEATGFKCNPPKGRPDQIELCASYNPDKITHVLHERLMVDVQLLVGGMLLGTLFGVLAGRWCAAHPDGFVTRILHVAVSFLQSCPPYFLAFLFLIWFSWNSGNYKLPFVSGQGDFVPFSDDPLQFLKAMWVPWVCAGLSLAAFVARMTEATLEGALQNDFIRTAMAKGLGPQEVMNRHALPMAVPAITTMTGVNVSTLLINIATIEYGFALPGMFRTIRGAILGRDIAMLEALVLEGVILAVIANLIADLIHIRVDPRVRTASA